MKTSELSSAALDWAVAKCEGLLCFGYRTDGLRFVVESSDGEMDSFMPSTDWVEAGPIIEREWLQVTPWPNESDENLRWQCKQHDSINCVAVGPTPLIAAMRCFVSSHLGDEVAVPKELE